MSAARKWSQDVTEHSNALDLDRDVFTRDNPKSIATSLKHSADRSSRRKGSVPFMRRLPVTPLPYLSTALAAAFFTRGSLVRPR